MLKIVYICLDATCNDASIVCRDMDDDLEAAIDLKKRFPNQIFLIRYEDLALDPVYEIGKIVNFLDLDFTKSIRVFLESHTKGPRNGFLRNSLNFRGYKPATTITTTNCEQRSNVSASTAAITINYNSSVNLSFPTTATTSTTIHRRFFEPRRFHAHHLPRSGVQFDTYRNSKKNAFAWTNRLNFSTVKTIQEVCSAPMAKLGFNLMKDESQLKDPDFEILRVTDDLKFLQRYNKNYDNV
jgi:hypothetical protein